MAHRKLATQSEELKRSSVIDVDLQDDTRLATSYPDAPRTPPRVRAEQLPLAGPLPGLLGPLDPKPVKLKHLDAKRRYSKLYAKTVTLPPPMPSPFFTFHVPPPGVTALSAVRPIKRARSSAPGVLWGDPVSNIHPLYKQTYTQTGTFQPGDIENPADLPSSDALEPVNLYLPEEVEMMELDDESSAQSSDDPFLY